MIRSVQYLVFLLGMTMIFSTGLLAQEDLESGKRAFEAGNYEKAIEDLKDHISDNETDAQGYLWLARVYMSMDSIQQAKTELIKGNALAGSMSEIFTLLGDIYAMENISAAAAQQYEKAYALDSMNVGLLLKIAEAQMKSRKYTNAARTFIRVLALEPENLLALRTLSSLYVRSKQYTNALPVLEKLYPIQSDTMEVKYNYVKTLYETRGYEKLIPIAEELFQRDASLGDIQSMLGEAYKATKAYDRVVEIYAARPVDSLSFTELVGLAKAYRYLDENEKAVSIYEAALARDTAHCSILYDVGTSYMRVKDYPKAIETFNAKIECDTSSGYRFASHLNAAMSEMQLKNFKSAEEHTLTSIELRPEHIQARNTLAQIYVQMGNARKQRAAYQTVIDMATADTLGNGKYDKFLEEAYRMIGLQDLLDKKYEAAIVLLKKSLKLNTSDCTTILWTAQAYHNTNNVPEATKYYCRVLKLCPKNEDAKNGLEILGTSCGG